ncbi:MAG: nucleotidyltransferase domain-containing protein [Defluviitaleaceae bacterium]|nr:nucleotidyltransferase domain-containing protein [Defluviitaleaceae bacterium]
MLALDHIADILKPVLEKQGIYKATVFGSYARGNATPASDIDLVVDSKGGLKGIAFFIASDEISKALPIKSDIYEQREIKEGSALYNEILREGVTIYDK